MSLLTDVGAQVHATCDDLPLGLVGVAVEQLRTATELLDRVRQSSVDPIGVPQLGAALEHAERAVHQLLVTQDALITYLASIGLTGPAPVVCPEPRVPRPAPPSSQPGAAPRRPTAGPLSTWWRTRVAELTGLPGAATATGPAPDVPIEPAPSPGELLQRITGADRGRLAAELRAVDAGVGMGLAAVCAPILDEAARELLGREPRPADVPRLRKATARVRNLLPGGDPATLETLLAHACRAPATPAQGTHPADTAITAAVLAGILHARRGHPTANPQT